MNWKVKILFNAFVMFCVVSTMNNDALLFAPIPLIESAKYWNYEEFV